MIVQEVMESANSVLNASSDNLEEVYRRVTPPNRLGVMLLDLFGPELQLPDLFRPELQLLDLFGPELQLLDLFSPELQLLDFFCPKL
ncbi:hypothetical protein KUCAC02_023173 [Chaenocephalus aceratus]|uniref:Uncharacterized protein n=1 Tax=Chaenocephalus aceratus TaxID=36190 RepID=A0ACB9XPA6_CHAAC|nr:hypothetical protein KUCAC02_023173 [Chaenocephalus aceratus]